MGPEPMNLDCHSNALPAKLVIYIYIYIYIYILSDTKVYRDVSNTENILS